MNKELNKEAFLAQATLKSGYAFASGFPDGSLYVCNQAFCDLTGYTEAELREINWAVDLTPEEWQPVEADKLAVLHQTGEPQLYEKEYIRKDGTRVPVELNVHLVTDEAGNPEMYYTFVFDITERKRAQRQTQALYSISRALNMASDADALLQAIIPTFQTYDGFMANLFYLESDEEGRSEWAEVVAVWHREGEPATPVGTRLYLPEFTFSQLWLADSQAPLYITDITQDARVDQATQDFYMQIGLSATVVVPLAQAGRWVGVVSLNWREPHQFSTEERALFDTLPTLLAPAAESHRTALVQRKARERAEIVADISTAMSRAEDAQEILKALTCVTERYGVLFSALGYLLGDPATPNTLPDITEIKAMQSGDGQPMPLDSLPNTRFSSDEFPVLELLRTGAEAPLFSENVRTDPRIGESIRTFFEDRHLSALILMPLKAGGQWQGIITLNWSEPQTFDAELRDLLTILQPRVADIVAGRRAYLEVQAAQRRSEQIAQMNIALSAATDAQAMLNAMAQWAQRYGVSLSILYYAETNTQGRPHILDIVAACGDEGEALSLETFPVTHTKIADFPLLEFMFAAAGAPVFIEDIAADPRCEEGVVRELAAASNVAASIMLPLKSGDVWQGGITLNWDTPQTFDDEMRAILTAIVPTASTVVARSRLVSNLEQLVQERTSEIQASQRLLRQVIDTIPDVIYVKDAEERYVLANQAAADLFDTGPDALVGKTEEDFGLGAELFQEYLAVNRQVRETQQPFFLPEHVVTDPETQEDRFYQSSILPITSEDGEVHQVVGISFDITERKQMEQERERLQQEIIEAQREALKELSVPVIPVMDRILVMPLVGNIDTMRAQDIMRGLLRGISEHRAKFVILDVTGVPLMDTGIVNHLNKTIQAARLKGAQVIVTGISDVVAEAIVDLGIDWGAVETLRDLQTGLRSALQIVNGK